MSHLPRTSRPARSTKKTPNPGNAEKYGHHQYANLIGPAKARTKSVENTSIKPIHHFSATNHTKKWVCLHVLTNSDHRVGGRTFKGRFVYVMRPSLAEIESSLSL